MGSQGAAPEGIISGKNHPEEPKEGTIITQKTVRLGPETL